MENFQEVFSHRIILSEFLFMLRFLEKGGVFVCKLFDSFSILTVSLMYMAGLLFEETYVVKPLRSRIVNSERYFVGRFLKARDEQLQKCVDILSGLHKKLVEVHGEGGVAAGSPVPYSPKSVVPLSIMFADQKFMESIRKMNQVLAYKQTAAVARVMNAVDDDERRGITRDNRR